MVIPYAFPDEILFSRLVRHFTLTGMTIADYLSMMFGDPKRTIHPYMTAGLTSINEFSQESPVELLYQQTLAPLFIYFLPSHETTLTNGLLFANAAKAIRACQLICVREKEALSIKCCPECARADFYEFGVTYWHRSHQIPGIEACAIHQVQLVHIPFVSRSRITLSFLPPLDLKPTHCSALSFAFALYSHCLLIQLTPKCKSFDLNEFKERLNKLGYFSKLGCCRRKKLLKELFQFTQLLGSEYQTFSPNSERDYRYISYLFSGKVNQHPFKYLLLGFWLSNQKIISKADCVMISSTSDKAKLEKKCIRLLYNGESMASVSRATGKSRCFVKALALKLNIPINLKPKNVTYLMKLQIMHLANRGFHRKSIADRVGVSVGSVEQQISTSPVLVQRRKQCKYESKRRKYKLQIIRFMLQNDKAIRQQIKSSCNAAFFWLLAHEKLWLEEYLPSAQRAHAQPRVDWHKRDIILVETVSSIMRQYKNQLSRTQLDKILGGHGWLTKKKHKLPETLKKYQELYQGK